MRRALGNGGHRKGVIDLFKGPRVDQRQCRSETNEKITLQPTLGAVFLNRRRHALCPWGYREQHLKALCLFEGGLVLG
jgi:hypothetical protein